MSWRVSEGLGCPLGKLLGQCSRAWTPPPLGEPSRPAAVRLQCLGRLCARLDCHRGLSGTSHLPSSQLQGAFSVQAHFVPRGLWGSKGDSSRT